MNPAPQESAFSLSFAVSCIMRSLVDCGVLSGTAGWFGMVKSGVGMVNE